MLIVVYFHLLPAILAVGQLPAFALYFGDAPRLNEFQPLGRTGNRRRNSFVYNSLRQGVTRVIAIPSQGGSGAQLAHQRLCRLPIPVCKQQVIGDSTCCAKCEELSPRRGSKIQTLRKRRGRTSLTGVFYRNTGVPLRHLIVIVLLYARLHPNGELFSIHVAGCQL
jgi:hypothetical protein